MEKHPTIDLDQLVKQPRAVINERVEPIVGRFFADPHDAFVTMEVARQAYLLGVTDGVRLFYDAIQKGIFHVEKA